MTFSEEEILEWEAKYQIGGLISRWRRPLVGEVSIEETADAVGIVPEVKRLIAGGHIYHFKGRSGSPGYYKIELSQNLDEPERALTFAHELGHLIECELGILKVDSEMTAVEYERRERFAEYFGRRFILAGGVELPFDLPDVPKPNLLEATISNGQNWSEL